MARCRHCGRESASRPRGLGYHCYADPAIRRLYPAGPGAGGPGDDNRAKPTPAEPTTARPGSEAKIVVMTERDDRGEGLHHPDDLRVVRGSLVELLRSLGEGD